VRWTTRKQYLPKRKKETIIFSSSPSMTQNVNDEEQERRRREANPVTRGGCSPEGRHNTQGTQNLTFLF